MPEGAPSLLSVWEQQPARDVSAIRPMGGSRPSPIPEEAPPPVESKAGARGAPLLSVWKQQPAREVSA
jgi:hypothetical protein